MTTLHSTLTGLPGAEDIFRHYDVPFVPAVLDVYRLHILRQFHDLLRRQGIAADTDAAACHATCRTCLQQAYAVHADSPAPERPSFRVFQRGTPGAHSARLQRWQRSTP